MIGIGSLELCTMTHVGINTHTHTYTHTHTHTHTHTPRNKNLKEIKRQHFHFGGGGSSVLGCGGYLAVPLEGHLWSCTGMTKVIKQSHFATQTSCLSTQKESVLRSVLRLLQAVRLNRTFEQIGVIARSGNLVAAGIQCCSVILWCPLISILSWTSQLQF